MMNDFLRVGALQLNSTPDVDANGEQILHFIERAAEKKVHWLVLPEFSLYFGPPEHYFELAQDKIPQWIQKVVQKAMHHHMALTFGGVFTPATPPKVYQSALFFDPKGMLLGHYHKMHLFDVQNKEAFKESQWIEAGEKTTVLHWKDWTIGLSICYDLRFPELYRKLRAQGAEILTIPSAFLVRTGSDHWLTLLKARAIENQSYVIAPNQWGRHYKNLRSYGRSSIIDPWGITLTMAPDRPALITADLHIEPLQSLRKTMPVHKHRKIKS